MDKLHRVLWTSSTGMLWTSAQSISGLVQSVKKHVEASKHLAIDELLERFTSKQLDKQQLRIELINVAGIDALQQALRETVPQLEELAEAHQAMEQQQQGGGSSSSSSSNRPSRSSASSKEDLEPKFREQAAQSAPGKVQGREKVAQTTVASPNKSAAATMPGGAGAAARGGAAPPASGAGAQKLTDKDIEDVVAQLVTQLHNLSANAGTAAQVPIIIEEAKKLGLQIDLQARRWSHVDGRHGRTEPFSIEGGASNGGGPAAGGGGKVMLDDNSLAMALSNLVQLQRDGDQLEVNKMIAAAASLGVTIDLSTGRWRTSDGRAGTIDPFAIETGGGGGGGGGGELERLTSATSAARHGRALEFPSQTRGQEIPALCRAAQRSDVATLLVLLESGEPVDTANEVGDSVAAYAASRGSESCLALLIERKANLLLANKMGITPLHRAASNGHEKAVEILLAHGADPSAADHEGCTPLHAAAANGSTTCLHTMLGTAVEDLRDLRNVRGCTALHAAALCGKSSCLELLLDFGAKDLADLQGATAFDKAVSAGHAACAGLLERHADEVAAEMIMEELLEAEQKPEAGPPAGAHGPKTKKKKKKKRGEATTCEMASSDAASSDAAGGSAAGVEAAGGSAAGGEAVGGSTAGDEEQEEAVEEPGRAGKDGERATVGARLREAGARDWQRQQQELTSARQQLATLRGEAAALHSLDIGALAELERATVAALQRISLALEARRAEADAAERRRRDAEEARRLCIICMEREREVTFLPCGHCATCSACAPAVGSGCPTCRTPVERAIRTFMS